MLTQKWIYTDATGVNHICQKVGRKPQTICVDGAGTPEENMIFALRELSCDPEVMLGSTIKKCSSAEATGNFFAILAGKQKHCYFIQMISSNRFKIILNQMPFWFGDEHHNITAMQYKNITVFYYHTGISPGERISPYFYLEW